MLNKLKEFFHLSSLSFRAEQSGVEESLLQADPQTKTTFIDSNTVERDPSTRRLGRDDRRGRLGQNDNLKTTTTLQEYQKIPWKNIYFYGFIAIVDGWKIKVIVKKRGKGKLAFWSVIPNWTTNKKRDRLLHKGNMETD